MPLTAEEWLAEFLNNTTTAGAQSDPEVTSLSNGNFLVIWTDDNDTVASGTGTDIVGVIYDALGNDLSGPLFLNSGFGFSRNENDAVVAQTNDGGFVVVYEFPSGADNDLIYGRYDAAGARTQSGYIVNDTGSAIVYRDASVAVAADNSFFVTYEKVDGALSTVNGKKVTAAGAVGAEVELRADGTAVGANQENPTDPDTVLLAGGDFATVYRENDVNSGSNEFTLEVRISNPDGTNGALTNNVTLVDGVADSDPHIAALTGGGMVVTWTEGNDIKAQRLSATGVKQGGEISVATGTDSQNESDVTGLADGGFFVVWDNDTDLTIEGQRFNSSGVAVGGVVVVTNAGNPTQPVVSLMEDGRILVSWNEGSDIYTQILDIRDNATVGGDYQVGTIGDDVFTQAGGNASYGWDGNDTITEGSGDDIFGGNGNDTIIISSIATGDVFDGGFGNDTLAFLTTSDDLVVDLSSGVFGTDTITSFENLTGSDGNDTLTGTGGSNVINGGNGNDTIIGGFSTDTVNGGAGDDTFIINTGEFSDNISGGSGTDTLDVSSRSDFALTIDLGLGTYTNQGPANTISSVETILGTQLADTITSTFGYQTLNGNGGNDTFIHGNGQFIDDINGGSGIDVLDTSAVTNPGEGITFDLLGNTWTGLGGARTLVSIETVIGTQLDDIIISTFGTQTLDGQGGDDTFIHGNGQFIDNIDGGVGSDTLDLSDVINGGEGVIIDLGAGTWDGLGGSRTIAGIEDILGTQLDDDINLGNVNGATVNGQAGNDTLTGGLNFQTINGGQGDDIIDGGFAAGSGVGDILNGNAGDDDITGADGSDTITGGSGNDTITSNGGNDTINGQSGNDVINGGAGEDDILGASGDDTILGEDGDDTINGNGGDDTINGGDGNDTINGAVGFDFISGFNGDDVISGGNQNDVLNGNAGDDIINGDAGNDTLTGGGGNDSLTGASGQDTINGGGGFDMLFGNAGGDDLFGGGGNDVLDGGGGNDDLNGGAGADIFVANLGFRTDRIQDFEDGTDMIDFSGNSLANNFAQVLAAASQVGANVRIDLNPNNTLILENFDLSDLDASDFMF